MKHMMYSLLAAALLASCTQNELPEQGTTEIKLASTVNEVTATTRTPFDGAISASNTLTALVVKSVTSGDYLTTGTDVDITGTMTFGANASTTAVGFTTAQYYPADETKSVYLSGLYPTTGWTGYTTAGKVNHAIDGKTDLIAAKQVTTTKTQAQASTFQELKFEHQLTKLHIKVLGDANAKKMWGDIKTIELAEALGIAPNKLATVDLTDLTKTTYAAGTGSVGIYQVTGGNTYTEDLFTSKTVAIPATSTLVAYSLAAPITATKTKDFKLKIYTTLHTTAYEVDVNLNTTGSTKGKFCDITLTFQATDIQAKATISDWQAGASSGITIQ